MHRSPYRFSLVVVVGVLGLLIATSFNTTTRAAEVTPAGRSSDLIDVVRDMESQRGELQDRLADLREAVSLLEQEAAEGSGVTRSFTQEFDRVRLSAGLAEVHGPGVEVVLADAKDVAQGADPNDYLIHDTDIAAVVNALFVGGAEAVSVNGERVVATTPIRCAGTTILVNSTRLGSPYVVTAIGESDALQQALAEDGHASLLFDSYTKQYGLQVAVTRKGDVTVPAYMGSLRPTHSSPRDGGI